MQSKKTARVKLGDQVVSINRIHLDPINPRHDPLVSDTEVIKQLCKNEKIGSLAQDIAAMGALSPLESIGVVPMDGNPTHFICLEGNRRTCALLLLQDPSRAPSMEFKSLVEKLRVNKKIPNKVKVYVFPDRESAKPWIDRRHLGEQDGVGIRTWDTPQQARAVGSNTRTTANANVLPLAIVNRLLSKGLITESESKKVSLTTLSRYLGTPSLRAILGLASSKELRYTHKVEEVDRALLKLVIDSLTRGNDGACIVNSRTNSQQRLQYGLQLVEDGFAPKTLLKEVVNLDDSNPNIGVNPTKLKSAPDPNKRRNLFDSGQLVVPANDDKVLLRLRIESLNLDLEDFPFGGNYLLRALIERIMIKFLKARKILFGKTDEQLTQACATELEKLCVPTAILNVVKQAASSRAQPHSLYSLGHTVHGGAVPSRKHLLAMADTWQPALKEMIKYL